MFDAEQSANVYNNIHLSLYTAYIVALQKKNFEHHTANVLR